MCFPKCLKLICSYTFSSYCVIHSGDLLLLDILLEGSTFFNQFLFNTIYVFIFLHNDSNNLKTNRSQRGTVFLSWFVGWVVGGTHGLNMLVRGDAASVHINAFCILLYVYDTMDRFLFSELILLSHLRYV